MHVICRSVVNVLFSYINLKGLSIRRFMRWAVNMGMGVMTRYDKIPVVITDLEVLEAYPYIRVWVEYPSSNTCHNGLNSNIVCTIYTN